MGFSGGGEAKIGERLVTNLIMPLKVAAAFALSFVMVFFWGPRETGVITEVFWGEDEQT